MIFPALIAGIAASLVVFALARAMEPGGILHRRAQLKLRLKDLESTPSASGHSHALLKTVRLSDIKKFQALLTRHSFFQDLADLLRMSRLPISVMAFLCISGLLGLLVYFMLFRAMNPIVAIAAAATAAAGPYMGLKFGHRLYIDRFTKHLPDALSIIGRSIKVGHGLSAAIELVGRTAPYPISDEFRGLYSEMQLGVEDREAFRHLYQRIPTPEVKIMTTGIMIHQEVGGNLSELLENLEKTIRDRFTILREIRALSSQGKLTSWILLIGPLCMAGLWIMQDPKMFSEYLASDFGKSTTAMGLGCQIAGFIWARMICRLKD